jgi:hypothetical protein
VKAIRILGVAVVALFSVGILVLLAFGALAAVGGGPARLGRVEGVNVAYVKGEATVRECPRLACRAVLTLKRNQQVTIEREVAGDFVRDSDIWSEIRYGDDKRYVHSSLLSATSVYEQSLPWILISVLAIPTLALVSAVARSNLIQGFIEWAGRGVDIILPTLVLVLGIFLGVIGFIYSQVEGTEVASFTSDVLTNLGAGLVGAAVTFILFQSLFAGRNVERAQVTTMMQKQEENTKALLTDLKRLQERVAELQVSLDEASNQALRPKDRSAAHLVRSMAGYAARARPRSWPKAMGFTAIGPRAPFPHLTGRVEPHVWAARLVRRAARLALGPSGPGCGPHRAGRPAAPEPPGTGAHSGPS